MIATAQALRSGARGGAGRTESRVRRLPQQVESEVTDGSHPAPRPLMRRQERAGPGAASSPPPAALRWLLLRGLPLQPPRSHSGVALLFYKEGVLLEKKLKTIQKKQLIKGFYGHSVVFLRAA